MKALQINYKSDFKVTKNVLLTFYNNNKSPDTKSLFSFPSL